MRPSEEGRQDLERSEPQNRVTARRSPATFTDLVHRRLAERLQEDHGAAAFHVTATFPGHRFNGRNWSGPDRVKQPEAANRRATEAAPSPKPVAKHIKSWSQFDTRLIAKLERFAPSMFELFRGLYIRSLETCIPRFRKKAAQAQHPMVEAFIDDLDMDEDSRYPHIHSVWVVPGGSREAYEKWLPKAGAETWRSHGGSGLHVRKIGQDPEELRRVLFYDSKLHDAIERKGLPGEPFNRSFPDEPREKQVTMFREAEGAMRQLYDERPAA